MPTSNTFSVTVSDWQLAASNYVSTSITGMLPNIIAPRPDGELGTYSRYKWAYPAIRYEVPIAVQGGSYPFKFTITATSGTATNLGTATIGETLTVSGDNQIRPDNYGVLEWTPASGDDTKTFGFTIQVEDQDGNIDTVTWTGTIQVSQFIFYDSTDTTSTETGSITEPYNDWHSAFGADAAATTNNDKLCYFRTGDHPLTGYSANSDNYRMENGNKCGAYINYPDESPSIDLTTGFFVLSANDDLFFSGINFHDNPTDRVGKMFSLFSSGDRLSWWRNTFTDFNKGTGGTNQAILDFSGVDRQYITLLSNTIAGNTVNFLQLYQVIDCVIEDNAFDASLVVNARDASTHGIVYLKDDPIRVSFRANNFVDYTTWNDAGMSTFAIGGQDGYQDVEICWNRLINPQKTSSFGRGTIELFVESDPSLMENVKMYRNSLDGWAYESSGTKPSSGQYVGYNFSVTSFEAELLTNTAWRVVEGNLTEQTGGLDASLSLTGTARTNYLGTHGAEIA